MWFAHGTGTVEIRGATAWPLVGQRSPCGAGQSSTLHNGSYGTSGQVRVLPDRAAVRTATAASSEESPVVTCLQNSPSMLRRANGAPWGSSAIVPSTPSTSQSIWPSTSSSVGCRDDRWNRSCCGFYIFLITHLTKVFDRILHFA